MYQQQPSRGPLPSMHSSADSRYSETLLSVSSSKSAPANSQSPVKQDRPLEAASSFVPASLGIGVAGNPSVQVQYSSPPVPSVRGSSEGQITPQNLVPDTQMPTSDPEDSLTEWIRALLAPE